MAKRRERVADMRTLTNFVSVNQYAKRVGKTVQGIRKALKEGRLYGGKIGHQWIIPVDAAIKAELRRRKGRDN